MNSIIQYFTFDYDFFFSILIVLVAVWIPIMAGWVVSQFFDINSKVWHYSLYLPVGVSLIVLVLQNFVYADVPVGKSAGWALVVLVAIFCLLVLRSLLSGRFRLRGDFGWVVVFGSLVWLINGVGYLRETARWYVGYGWQDQYNYMVTSEFLKEYPYSTSLGEIDSPYLIQAVEKKSDRIGQSIYMAFVASVVNISSDEAYGAVSLLSPLLTYFAFLYIFAGMSVRKIYAQIFALGAGVLPAVSVIHLECFLSQALGTPLLLVVIAFIMRLDFRKISWRDIVVGSILIAGTNSVYSEYLVFVVVAMVCKLFFSLLKTPRLIGRFGFITLLLSSLSLLVNLRYIPASLKIFGRTGLGGVLTHVYPFSHSVYGYTRLYWGDLFVDNKITLILLGLFFVVGLVGMVMAVVRQKSVEVLVLLCFVLVPIVLNLTTNRYSYQAYKLMLSFSPLILIGWGFLINSLTGKRSLLLSIIAACLLVIIPIRATAKLSNIAFYGGGRSVKMVINTDAHRQIYVDLEKRTGENLFLDSTHPYELARMVYYGRNNNLWFMNRVIGDFDTTALAGFRYTKIDEMPDDIKKIRGIMLFPSIDNQEPLFASIEGSIEGTSSYNLWNWLGASKRMLVYSKNRRKINIVFDTNSGPANSDRRRVVKVSNLTNGESREIEFVESRKGVDLGFLIEAGFNDFVFETIYPTEVSYIPNNDKRVFMVRLGNMIIK